MPDSPICRCDGIGRRSGLKIHRQRWRAGSSPATGTSSEIPITAPFPPVGENCAIMGISSLSAPTRSAGLGAEGDGDFALPQLIFTVYCTSAQSELCTDVILFLRNKVTHLSAPLIPPFQCGRSRKSAVEGTPCEKGGKSRKKYLQLRFPFVTIF